MPDAIVIGLDLGTTTCKAIAADEHGLVLAVATSPIVTQFIGEDRAEQDPVAIRDVVAKVLQSVVHALDGRVIAGIVISGAMHSLIPIDDTDRPLAPASIWSDRRAVRQAVELRSSLRSHDLYRDTGCGVRWLYHPPRIRWWLEVSRGIANKIRRFVSIKDWITHLLTGCWSTDTSLASTTGLLDIRTLTWHAGALDAAGIDKAMLPRLVLPCDEAGCVTSSGAAWSGVPAGVRLFGGGSDGPLANLGASGAALGTVVISVGTSGAIRLVVSSPKLDARERTWCYSLVPGRWVAGGAIANAGLALQWVRDRWFPQVAHDEMIRRAAEVVPGAEGLLFLPYLTGERNPHWNNEARAMMHGLTLSHRSEHLARAAMEGVAYCLADVWDALQMKDGTVQTVRLTGGITQSPAWCQICSDVLGVPVETTEGGDASALGAIRLAHVGLGIRSLASLDDKPAATIAARFNPVLEHHTRYKNIKKQFQKLAGDIVLTHEA